MKVAFITNHPAPYRDDTLKIFSMYDDIELDVLNVEKLPSNHREWHWKAGSFNSYLKKPIHIPILGLYNPGIIKKLKGYDLLIIGSYYPATMLVALVYSYIKKIPYVICTDAVKGGQRFNFIKKKFIEKLWLSAQGFWVPGEMSKKYLIEKKVAPEKIFLGYYTNDAAEMHRDINKTREIEICNQYKINNDFFKFLFVGKLIPTRHIERLIEAVKILNQKRKDFCCIIIGDGIDSKLLNNDIESIVHIREVPYDKLHGFYKIADAYIHPGSEPFSLATVEAFIAGIPVVSTSEVGATADYLKEEINGYIFDNTARDLAKKMDNVLNGLISEDETKKMQKFIIEERSTKWAAKELHKAVMNK